jgi:beta-glucosidase
VRKAQASRRSVAGFIAVLGTFFAPAVLHAQNNPFSDESRARAEALLKQMTLAEKIGQLNLVGGAVLPGRPTLAEEDIVAGKVGGVLWMADPQQISRVQRIAVQKSRLKIPILFGLDVIHGFDTMFPIPLAMASSWDPSVQEAAQSFAAREAAAAGIRWTFAPMVDISTDARWGRAREGAGEDPFLASVMARAQVRGFQGQALNADSVLACAKHFAGYGAAEGGRDYDSSYIPEVQLRNVYLKPFKAAVDEGVGTLMSAYMNLNDIPASSNRWLLTEVLRGEWGFQGFLTSDAHAIKNLQVHHYAADPADAAMKAINAGANMEMASELFVTNLPRLIADKKVSEAQIDAAVLPILATKFQLGLFDGRAYEIDSQLPAGFSHAEGRALSRKIAARSMVLLKNDNATLPLKSDLKKVAVVGLLADSPFDTQGGPSARGAFTRVEKHSATTVLAALRARLSASAQVDYVAGPGLSRVFRSAFENAVGYPSAPAPSAAEIDQWLTKTRDAAANAEVVIAVVGETAFMSGEEGSRATLSLPGIQQQMLEAAAAAGKPVVVVMINGRPLDIQWAAENVPAILEAWHPGVEGGNAVADVLFGDVNPGGKLPMSWPRSVGQGPLYYNHNRTHHPEDEPGFTSRYWDMSSQPLFRFGYGLSYTTFKFDNLRMSQDRIDAGDTTEVSVDVANTGAVAGDVVGQLYFHQRSGSASRPARQLAGFQRVHLKAGETRTLKFKLGEDELAFWSPETKRSSVEPALYDVWVGEDSGASLQTQFTVLHIGDNLGGG